MHFKILGSGISQSYNYVYFTILIITLLAVKPGVAREQTASEWKVITAILILYTNVRLKSSRIDSRPRK